MSVWNRGEYVRVHGDPPSDYARMEVVETFLGLAWCRHLDSGRLFLVEENCLVWHPIPKEGEALMRLDVEWIGIAPKIPFLVKVED